MVTRYYCSCLATFLLSSSYWVVVRQALGSHLTVVRQPSGIYQAVARQLAGSCQAVISAVNEKMNQWFQGTPEKSCLVNRGQGRGQTENSLQGTEGDIP